MTLDIDGLRAATPGCERLVHFNHAGASLPSRATLAAIAQHLDREALGGAMETGAAVQSDLEAIRADAAGLIGASPSEIAFMTSGSTAFGLLFAALPRFGPGDRILVGRHEWGGNLGLMRLTAAAAGAVIEAIPCRDDGSVDPEALAAMIDDRVRLISLTWLPANGGLINDAAAVGRIARAAGIPYYLDAAQAVGQLPVDVRILGCDVLTAAGRKHLRGPRGTGLLYVRKAFQPRLAPVFYDVQSAPWESDGPVARDDARVFEGGEASIALRLGLGEAVREARTLGAEAIQARVKALAGVLRSELGALAGVRIQDLGAETSGLVSFTVDGLGAQEVRSRLAAEQINIAANGVAYTPLDMTTRGLTEIARASVSYLNTEAEITRLVAAVARLARAAA